MTKVIGFRIAEHDLKKLDDIVSYHGIGTRTGGVEWLIREEHKRIDSVEKRLKDLQLAHDEQARKLETLMKLVEQLNK